MNQEPRANQLAILCSTSTKADQTYNLNDTAPDRFRRERFVVRIPGEYYCYTAPNGTYQLSKSMSRNSKELVFAFQVFKVEGQVGVRVKTIPELIQEKEEITDESELRERLLVRPNISAARSQNALKETLQSYIPPILENYEKHKIWALVRSIGPVKLREGMSLRFGENISNPSEPIVVQISRIRVKYQIEQVSKEHVVAIPGVSEEKNKLLHVQQSPIDELKDQECRFCLQKGVGKDQGVEMNLVSPCACKGTAKYIHLKCLCVWIKRQQANQKELRCNCKEYYPQYIGLKGQHQITYFKLLGSLIEPCIHFKHSSGELKRSIVEGTQMEIGEEEESWLKIGVPGAGSPNSCIRLKENTSELLLEDKNSTYGTYYSEKGLQLRVGEGRPVPVIRVGQTLFGFKV